MDFSTDREISRAQRESERQAIIDSRDLRHAVATAHYERQRALVHRNLSSSAHEQLETFLSVSHKSICAASGLIQNHHHRAFSTPETMALKHLANESNESTPLIPSSQDMSQVIPPRFKFWSVLFFEIPSLACTIFLLYHLLFDRRLRQALNNHVIIVLLVCTLIIEIVDNSLYLDANRMGGVINSFTLTPSICLVWWLVDYGLYGATAVFLAWGSIERHILIFHQRQLLRTARQRFVVHYLPLITLSVYLTVFYVIVILFPPCENMFDSESLGCGFSPCYRDVPFLNLWDYNMHGIACALIETASSIALMVRVFWQKRRAHRQLVWRKHRKMAFQLLSVSCLSFTTAFPTLLLVVIRQMGGPNLSDFGSALDPYLIYIYLYMALLLPFICLGCLSELWPKIGFLSRKRLAIVRPLIPMVSMR